MYSLTDFNLSVQRFIYGFAIDFKLSELYESYVAADKYLLHEFNKEFFDYIKGKLNPESSCLIYDQLMKIGDREEISLADVRTVIIENSKDAFESKHFRQIDQETLISLLSLDELSIAEFDLFVAVSKWVDCEVERQDLPVNGLNRLRMFEPIKSYILFTALTLEQIANGKELGLPLTNQEKGLLVMHRLNKVNQSPIELKTSRKASVSACSVFISESGSVEFYSYSHSRTMYLSLNRRVYIKTFSTIYSGSAANLSFKIQNSKGVDLDLKTQISLQDGKWSFTFRPPFKAEPDCLYTLQITGDDQLARDQPVNTPTLENPKYSIIFNMGPNSEHPEYSGRHFVEGITYFPSSDFIIRLDRLTFDI